MVQRILIEAVHPEETRVAVADDSRLEEFDFESSSKKQIKGNIYLGKVTRVEPSLQAAFVEYGGNRQGFLPFSELHFDYYQIPVSDKEDLIESMIKESIQEGDEDISENEESKSKEERDEENSDLQNQDVEIEEETAKDDDIDGSIETNKDSKDGDIDDIRRNRNNFYRRYKIQEVLKRNQIILVQVIKEERGNKGVALTTYISLAGRYCVLMPNTDRSGGVSRRITNISERKRLKNIVSSLEMQQGTSMIMRTAGIERSEEEIKCDFEYLMSTWKGITQLTLDSTAPALVHEEGNLITRSIRDMYKTGVEEIIVDGADAFKIAKNFMKSIASDKSVTLHKHKNSLFHHYGIDGQLDELYDCNAELKSGGSIVITPTEALVSIDVNSGRSTGERSIEETALKTNLEAAEEIARQLRLRDLAGLVVIDFIDMRELRNRRQVEKTLKKALLKDRAKIQVGRISIFGLLEMSRQRMRSSIMESSSKICPSCNGTGAVRSDESLAIKLLRIINQAISDCRQDEISFKTSSRSAFYLLNSKRADIAQLEEKSGLKIFIEGDKTLSDEDCITEKPKFRRKRYLQSKSSRKNSFPKVNDTTLSQEKKKRSRPPRKTAGKRSDVKKEIVDGNLAKKPIPDVRIKTDVDGNTSFEKKATSMKREKPKEIAKEKITNLPKTIEKKPIAKKTALPKSESSRLKGLWKKITQ